MSGFKRFYPACRRHLETSHMYHRNWCKTIVRISAFPISADLVKGMAAVAYTEQQPMFGAAILLAFFGFLRVSELLQLRVAHFKFTSKDLLRFVLVNTKGTQLKGSPEVVQIVDLVLIVALTSLMKSTLADDLVFPFFLPRSRSFHSQVRCFLCFFA